MQKHYSLFIALSLITCQLLLFSCNNKRNPNLSEKQLLALMNDTTRKPVETSVSVLADTSYVPPAGARYTENRSVDPTSPPITLKVSVTEGAKQPLRLSMFGSLVEYVTLRLPNENDFFSMSPIPGFSTFLVRGGTMSNRSIMQVNMMGDHIVVSDAMGVRLFDPSGKFVQNLLMSEFKGGEQNAEKVSAGDILNNGFRQAVMTDFVGGRCFLTFIDHEGMGNPIDFLRKGGYEQGGLGQKIWAGEFDLSKQPLYSRQREIRPLMYEVEMAPVRTIPSGLFIDEDSRFNFGVSFNRGMIAVTLDNMGDTLCIFTNHIESGGAYISDRAFFYRSDNELFFRQQFCDTVFRVQSANRIVPAYRFDFGSQKLTPNDGATNRTQGKLVPWKWTVFKNSMLLIFSEGRDCPACRTRNEATFHSLLFDKLTGRSTAIDMKSQYPENILIENDLDGGLPIPLNSLSTEGNIIIATFTKSQIEEILRNNARNIPAETAAKLRSQANTLKTNEMLVMKIY